MRIKRLGLCNVSGSSGCRAKDASIIEKYLKLKEKWVKAKKKRGEPFLPKSCTAAKK